MIAFCLYHPLQIDIELTGILHNAAQVTGHMYKQS